MNKTELSDVIYENCSKINGKTSEAKFENRSLLKPSIQLKTFPQRSSYNGVRYEY